MGAISWLYNVVLASQVQTTITTPEDYPASADFYYLALSVYDDANSYDQIGLAATGGNWYFWYSYTYSGPGHDICSTTPEYYGPIFSPLYPLTSSATANTQFTFAINSYKNGTIGFSYALGSSMKYTFNTSYAHTGGNSLVLQESYFCTDSSNSGYFDDYTVYEEVYTTTQTVWPDWSFTFTNNYVVLSAGGTTYTNWYPNPYNPYGAPSGVTAVISRTSGNVASANQGGNLTIGTTLGSGNIAYYYSTPGGVINTWGDTYQVCCSGGGTASLTFMTLPSGWTYTYTPSSGTPAFGFTLQIDVSSSATLGQYTLEAELLWAGTGDFTLALFYVYLSSGGGHGGGGCVAWGTSILTPSGHTRVQTLGKGESVTGYWYSNDTATTETIQSVNFSWATQTISVNNGLLNVTTKDQPLEVKNGSWIGVVRDPVNLSVGESLFNPVTREWISITSLRTVNGIVPIYDVRTNGAGSFVAGTVLAFVKAHGGGI